MSTPLSLSAAGATAATTGTVALVRQDSPDPVPDEEEVSPGWIGALVVLGLIVVTVLLWLSMRRQFRKIRFDQSDPAGETPGETRGETPGETPGSGAGPDRGRT